MYNLYHYCRLLQLIKMEEINFKGRGSLFLSLIKQRGSYVPVTSAYTIAKDTVQVFLASGIEEVGSHALRSVIASKMIDIGATVDE